MLLKPFVAAVRAMSKVSAIADLSSSLTQDFTLENISAEVEPLASTA